MSGPSSSASRRFSYSSSSGSLYQLHRNKLENDQDWISKNGQQRYELSSEDGLDARIEDLKTYEDRWIAFNEGKIYNFDDSKQRDYMITRPLDPARWAFRVFWNIITIAGFLTSIYDSLVTNFKWVITLLFSSLLLSLKDYINDWWDSSAPADTRTYHWAATSMTIIIFVLVLKCLILVEWIWETGIYKESSEHLERRLRRQRFKYLQDEQEIIDPFCRDFTMIYNDEIDPDIAMCVYRSATDYMPAFLWFVQPGPLLLSSNRVVRGGEEYYPS